MIFHSNGRLLALLTNIRLGWKCMATASTLICYNMKTITAVKRFIVQALNDQTNGLYYKHVTIVNDDASVIIK